MAQLNFNATTVAPQDTFDVIPPGWYNTRITASEMKPTKDGSGSYLALTLTVIDGPAANRKLFDRLNLNNKNKVAVDIAYQTLSSICHATGIIQLGDSTQLHGIPLMAKVKIKPAEGQYSEGNEIGGYKKCEGAVGGQPAAPAWVAPAQQQQPAVPAFVPQAPAQPAAPPQQAAGPAVPPWAK
jgi:hypothetical protein